MSCPCVFCREPVAAGESESKWEPLCGDCYDDPEHARKHAKASHLEGPQ